MRCTLVFGHRFLMIYNILLWPMTSLMFRDISRLLIWSDPNQVLICLLLQILCLVKNFLFLSQVHNICIWPYAPLSVSLTFIVSIINIEIPTKPTLYYFSLRSQSRWMLLSSAQFTRKTRLKVLEIQVYVQQSDVKI